MSVIKKVPKPKSRAEAERGYHVAKAKRAGIKSSKNLEVDKSYGKKKFKPDSPKMTFISPTSKTPIKNQTPMLGSLEDAMAASRNPWERIPEKNSPRYRQFSKGMKTKNLRDSAKPGKFEHKKK